MSNQGIIDALRAGLSQRPDDLALRLHLAGLLAVDQPEDAHQELQQILSQDPAHSGALAALVDVERALGNEPAAQACEALLMALGSADEQVPDTSSRPTSVVSSIGPDQSRQSSEASMPDADDAKPRVSLVAEASDDNVTQGPWEDFEPSITLDDVGGMAEVKERLNMAFLAPMQNPELSRMYGKSLQGGLMLYGPPGCGKTYIARALAGELGASFFSVGLADVLDMYLGESERRLHELFEAARRKTPAVLFFDEIDALGQKRSQMRNSAGRTIVNQLLTEMDSVDGNNRNLFILAATNHPWDVDAALRRPGRFDRTVLVLPPDQAARAEILRHHLRDRPTEGIDCERVAQRCDGFSGADLAYLCESASEQAMQESIRSGTVRPIGMPDFEAAVQGVKPSTRSWFETARNFALFANDGGMYDDLLDYIRSHKL